MLLLVNMFLACLGVLYLECSLKTGCIIIVINKKHYNNINIAC